MSAPEVVVHPDADVLAAAVAARLVTTLADAQLARGSASVVLTGGGTGIAALEQVRRSPARGAVDWSCVDVYWGDERFLPAGDPERNDTQARAALLEHVGVDPERVFAMGTPVEGDVDTAAAAYAARLAARAAAGESVPRFDVLLLGMGGDGHVASVFAGSPAVRETRRSVVGVRDSPKPPPTRVTLALSAIRCAEQVWVCAAGSGKARAVAAALGGSPELELPAAGARGRTRTLWLLDSAAAAGRPGPG